ncbi:hypothetical protein [Rathayibacter sp. VKM Ac-2754]|uniref:hypothetical protein n=1 Tax=Rathayibacter sp. VKM Ac-2754 TaxID=2609251 RepID=UPI001359A946|nr:hypothetical protein [Rathayibacter sp. VKM Ac-2754]MWV60648.1 hypothetical protein [Rathayibacter sp. VKM Ac-2754]
MGNGGDRIENERRETATGRTEWAPPSAAEVSDAGSPASAPRPGPWWRRRSGLILAAVLAGLVLLGGGFGVGYGVGNAVGSSSVAGFDPSQRGETPEGGFGQGGPGSQFPGGTDSESGGASGTTTS